MTQPLGKPQPTAATGSAIDAEQRAERKDELDETVDNWMHEREDLDFEWMKVVLRIRRLEKYLHDNSAEIVPEVGCGRGELEVVGQLRSVGPPYSLRPTDLFLALSLTSGAITGRIDRLVALGWVKREPSGPDRRSSRVRLTKKGIQISNRLVEHGAQHSKFSKALKRVPDSERREFIRVLDKLYKLVRENQG